MFFAATHAFPHTHPFPPSQTNKYTHSLMPTLAFDTV